MADAVASKAIEGNLMGVQVPSPALFNYKPACFINGLQNLPMQQD